MIGVTLLVLVIVVMIIGGLFLLPESFLVGFRPGMGVEHGLGTGDADPEDIVNLAEAYVSNKEFHNALQCWTRYLEVTNDSTGNYRRALVLQRLGEHDRAIGDFLTVEQKKGSLPPSYFLHRARSWQKLDEPLNAVNDYERYLEANPDDYERYLEAARCAARHGQDARAEKWFEHVSDGADAPRREEAKLALAEFLVDCDDPAGAGRVLETLDEDRLTSFQKRVHLFVKARINEERGNSELAHELYQTLYDRDSTFRNVEQKIREHRATISDDNLLHDFKQLDRADLAECCRNVVRIMGYEPMESDSLNEEEVNVIARDETSSLLKMDRYIFAFKQWDGYVGMLALKEFEMTLLEGRYDRGFFLAPRGFKPSAMEYAKDSPKMELIGPETLVEHLREIL